MNKVISVLPVYRVNDREKDSQFFCQILGMKVLLEEGPMAYLGGHEGKVARLILEESHAPSLGSKDEIKKNSLTCIHIKDSELKQILHNQKISEDSSSFDFCLSDGNLFRVISQEIDSQKGEQTIKEGQKVLLSDFSVTSLSFNFSKENSLSKSLEILKSEGLVVENINFNYSEQKASNIKLSWDFEALKFQVSEMVNFKKLQEKFSNFSTYLDSRNKLLMIELPEGIELWFEK
ncbi:MAG: CppA C-terminal domain-containing protein [Lactovum sp.]